MELGKLSFDNIHILLTIVMFGLDSDDLSIRMLCCNLLIDIEVNSPAIMKRAFSRREVEQKLLDLLMITDDMQESKTLLQTLISCTRQINMCPMWLCTVWSFHWSVTSRHLLDPYASEVVSRVIKKFCVKSKNAVTDEGSELELELDDDGERSQVCAQCLGLLIGLLQKCLVEDSLLKTGTVLRKCIISVVPSALTSIVRQCRGEYRPTEDGDSLTGTTDYLY